MAKTKEIKMYNVTINAFTKTIEGLVKEADITFNSNGWIEMDFTDDRHFEAHKTNIVLEEIK